MARKRDVSPELWTDAKVLDLPWPAVAFYVGLISQADDEGRLEWDARQLTVRICGLRDDARLADVQRWMTAVFEVGLVAIYRHGGRLYAFHPNWARHQYVNRAKPSHLPSPDDPTSERLTDHAHVSDRSLTRQPSRASGRAPAGTPASASVTASASESDTASAARAPAREAAVAHIDGPLEEVRAVWNANRGPLPEVTKVPAKGEVRDALLRLREEAAGDLDRLGRAVAAASRDQHYREHRYGIPTFARHFLGRWAGASDAAVGLNGRQARTQAALERLLEGEDSDQARVGWDSGSDLGPLAIGGSLGGDGARVV